MDIVLEIWLPNALYYNVPYELFWELSPIELEPFKKAKEIEIKANSENQDIFAWVQGSYVLEAVASVFVGHEYPKQPRTMQTKIEISDGDKFFRWANSNGLINN